MQTAWIVSIGTELTLGQSTDTNSPWLARELAALGYRTTRHVTVADEHDEIRHALLESAAGADVVVVTGGLGPTADDLTRAALAAALGVPLELHAQSLEQIRAFFARRARPMPDSNRVQAFAPRGTTALSNPVGTAPGLHALLCGKPVFCLPGVPLEMTAMFKTHVAQDLRSRASGRALRSRLLHTFGLGESELGERLQDLMARGRNPEVGTTAQIGIVGVRINATAETPAAAEALLNDAESEVRSRLGTAIFGRDEDTLAGVVGAQLAETRQTVATAESCTGGLIGALLTDVPGSSRYYAGGFVTYANAAKQRLLSVSTEALTAAGAVSAAVAEQMAEGASAALGTDYALSVTGIAGPDGGTQEKPVGLVFIALRTPAATRTYEHRFGQDAPREVIRLRAARTALNLLRQELLRASGA
jgi:nicotinamide-nucleotide amidase